VRRAKSQLDIDNLIRPDLDQHRIVDDRQFSEHPALKILPRRSRGRPEALQAHRTLPALGLYQPHGKPQTAAFGYCRLDIRRVR
jgi:hypothetical protein